MRRNRDRNRKSDSLVSGCRKVKPIIVLVYIKKYKHNSAINK